MRENLPPIKLLNLTGGGDNLAENCSVLRDLIPINIFKYVIIIKLKMCTTGKILVEMPVPKIETSDDYIYIYIYIYILYIKFKFYFKPYLKNLGI